MKTINIEIEGKKYPMRATMGAMDVFKKETGKDPAEMNQESAVDMCTFIYGCVKSACRKDRVEFPYTLEDFMDSVDVETVLSWGDELGRLTDKGESKKKGE